MKATFTICVQQKDIKLEEHTFERADIKTMQNYSPKHNTFTAIYFTLTGLHALHILGLALLRDFLPVGIWRQHVAQGP